MLQAEISWMLRIGAAEIECIPVMRGRGKNLPELKVIRVAIAADGDRGEEVSLRRALGEVFAGIVKQHAAASAVRRPQPDVRVLISDAWLALTALHWHSVFARTADLTEAARQQFIAEGFTAPTDAVIRVDDAPGFEQMRMAVAYPPVLLETLRAEAATAGCRLVSILPLCVAAADYVRGLKKTTKGKVTADDASAVAVLEGETVRFIYLQSGGILPGPLCRDTRLIETPEATLRALWRRQQLRHPALEAVTHLVALGVDEGSGEAVRLLARQAAGDAKNKPLPRAQDAVNGKTEQAAEELTLTWVEPPAPDNLAGTGNACTLLLGQSARRFSALDVLKVPVRRSAAWRIAAVLLMCVAGGMTYQAVRLARLAHAQEAAFAVKTQAPPVKAQAVWTREEVARVRVVNEAIHQLNLPIGPVLRSLLPPKDIRVALLGIDIESDRQGGKAESATDGNPGRNPGGVSLKLSAEALSGGEMARYVSYLGDQYAIAGAYLVRHEMDETRSGQPYRFTVEIVWRE